MVRRLTLLAVTASIAAATSISHVASAQEPPPASAPSGPAVPAAEAASDTVILRNGGLYRGRIVELVPGDHVTLVTPDGEPKRVAWSDLDRVIAGPAPSGSPAVSPPSAPPERGASPPAASPATPPRLEAPPSELEPRPQWRHNRPLIYTGTALFAAGYVPVAGAALPSTAGLAGRIAVIFLTLGLACFGGGSSYICNAEHGAMQLLVPVAGPILFASNHPEDHFLNESGTQLSGLTKGLLYTSAGLQAAGLVTLVSGIVFGHYERVDTSTKPASSAMPSFFVRPLEAPGSVGISVGAYKW